MLDITEEVDIEDLLGVNIYKVYSETCHLSHPQLTNQIVSDIGLSKSGATPRINLDVTTNIPVNVRMRKNLINTFTISVS